MNIPVSQICALMILLSRMTHFEENSTPIVVFESTWKTSKMYLDKIFVFPTPESPINVTTWKNRHISYFYTNNHMILQQIYSYNKIELKTRNDSEMMICSKKSIYFILY